MNAHRRVAVLRRWFASDRGNTARIRTARVAEPNVSPAAAARLAEDVAAQVARLRTSVNGAIEDAARADDPRSTVDTLRAVDEGRTRLAEFDGSMRRLLADASVEREAESILAAAAEGLEGMDAPTSRAQRRRDLDDAIAIVHPALHHPRRRTGGFAERATALVAGAAALAVAVGLGSIVTSPPEVQGDLLRSAGDTAVASDQQVTDASPTVRVTGSDVGQTAGRPTSSDEVAGPSVDPYTLEIRWLLDPARGLLARLRDVATVRSLVMREFEGIVAGLATERPATVADLIAQAEALAREAQAEASEPRDAETADGTPAPGPDEEQRSAEPPPAQPAAEDEGTESQGSETQGTDGDATDDDAPTATDHAPEPPTADGGDDDGDDAGTAQGDDSGILRPPGGW